MADEKEKKIGMAVASFVCGILSLLVSLWAPVQVLEYLRCLSYSYYNNDDYWIMLVSSFVLGVLAIIFGGVDRKKQKDGVATAGFVMGIISSTICTTAFLQLCFILAE